MKKTIKVKQISVTHGEILELLVYRKDCFPPVKVKRIKVK